jgi:hypothetical protein
MPKNNAISNKITFDSDVRTSPSVNFYPKYSRFIFKALRKYCFQEFLNSMLKTEDIDRKKVKIIHVALYPVRKQNGSGIAGKCNPFTGRILIYPKTKKFCNVFGETYGKELLIAYVGNRARASLIHELLHLKYKSDAFKVRALTKKYFAEFMRENYDGRLGSLSLYNLVWGWEIEAAYAPC